MSSLISSTCSLVDYALAVYGNIVGVVDHQQATVLAIQVII